MSTATPYEPSTKPTDPTVNLRRRPNIDALAQTGITPTSTENAALQILALRPEVEQGILNDQAKQAVKARLFGEAEVPSMIGRFKVIRELGRGGTGIVYIAYDIELDRKIAVKLLNNERPDERTGSANARLLREAQSMARVSHPNIAAVHEVGMFCGQIYVAMEFVDGKTLAAWLQGNRELPWQDVLAVFRQAAAGLAAAHDAGLVHRDFKPANAILGEDDRLRVLDFGLARADATPGGIAALDRTDEGNLDMSSASIDDSKLDLSLTVTGTVLGTPAYMSPEQFLGQRIDAKSDQFSFCVALYEALYRERPFDGDTLSSLMAAVLAGKVRDTHSSRVPRWLRAVVLRGLRNDPEQRWPSMYALSKALTPEHRHRGPVFAALGLGALLTGAATSWLGQADAAAQICSGAQEQLTGVWDEPRRQQVREAMLATGAPGAETIVDRIGERLDAYAADFVAAHTDACEATNVRKEQTQELMAQRMTCLAERRHALAATTNLLAAADKQIAENAAEMVAGLPAIDRCNDPLYVAEQLKPPDDLNIKRRVDGARAMLTEASVREHAGKFSTALDLVEQAAESVKDIDYPPLTAEIALGRGSLLEMNSRYADARPALEEAYFTALSAGHTRVAIDAAVELVLVTGRRLMTPDAMQTWARHAEALIHRSGDDVQRARLAANLGKGAFLVSEYGTGADRQKKAREFYLTALKTYELKNDRLYIAHMQMAIGETYQYDQRTLDKSEEYFTSAIDSFKVAACDEHPGVALGLTLLASVHRMQERLDDAQAELEKAGDLIAATVGKDHRNYGLNLFGQAEVHISRKHWAVAEPLLRRALEIHSEREGPLHINTIGVRELLGNVLVRQGKYTEAITILDALVTDLEARTDPDPYYLAKTAQFLYEAHAGLRRGGEVVPRLQAIHDRLAQRLKPAAIPATILFALAQARLDRDHDLTAARPLVEAARANADSADHQDEELRQELDDWLARHPAPR